MVSTKKERIQELLKNGLGTSQIAKEVKVSTAYVRFVRKAASRRPAPSPGPTPMQKRIRELIQNGLSTSQVMKAAKASETYVETQRRYLKAQARVVRGPGWSAAMRAVKPLTINLGEAASEKFRTSNGHTPLVELIETAATGHIQKAQE